MTEVGQLISPKPQAINAVRGPQQDTGGEPNQDGEAGFQALLEVVEMIAARGGEVPARGELPKGLLKVQPGAAQEGALPPGFEVLRENAGQLAPTLQQLAVTNRPQAPQRPVAPIPQGRTLPSGLEALRAEVLTPAPAAEPAAPTVPKPIEQFLQAAAVAQENPQLQQDRQLFQAPKLETQIADSPRLEAVLQQQSSLETSNPVVRQVASNIQVIARGDVERVRFDLFPEELGRVQVQLQKTNGVARITIVTETAQAFEALQRGATGLQQSLSQAGFEADDMRFEHREGRGQNQQEAADRDDRRGDAEAWDERREEQREVLIRQAYVDERELFL